MTPAGKKTLFVRWLNAVQGLSANRLKVICHIVLSLSLSKDVHYNCLKGNLQYHIALLLSNDSNYDLCAICLKIMGKLHFTLQLSHTTHGKKKCLTSCLSIFS